MKPSLRSIAVTVVQSSGDKFGWALIEQTTGDEWHVLEAGPMDLLRYDQAMAAGLMRLQDMVPDLAQGPRQRTAPPHPPHARQAQPSLPADNDGPKNDAAAPRKGRLFGFGPLA